MARQGLEKALTALRGTLKGSCHLLTEETGSANVPSSGSKASLGSSLLSKLQSKGKPSTLPQAAFFARPETAEDVQLCVRCAEEWDLSISVIGGGHTNHSSWGEMVLDLSNMITVSANAEKGCVTVAGGAQLQDVVESASRVGLMVPLGTAPTVGVGLVLQGGIGHLSRNCGLSIDVIDEAQVVTADGRLLTVSTKENSDLFWAIRGCGPNFGVVVSVKLRGRPLQRFKLTSAAFPFPEQLSAAIRLLRDYGTQSATLGNDHSADAILYNRDGRLCLGVFDYDISGTSSTGSGTQVPGNFTKCDPGTVSRSLCESGWIGDVVLETRRVKYENLFDYDPYLQRQPLGVLLQEPHELGCFARAVFLPTPLEVCAADVLISRLREAPTPNCFVHFQHAGGAVNRVPADATAFDARRLEWSVVISGCWPRDQEATMKNRCEAWTLETVRALLPHSVGLYPTDLGPEDAEFVPAAFKTSLGRLQELKKEWDPKNRFSCALPLLQQPAENSAEAAEKPEQE